MNSPHEVARALRSARSVAVMTGAGISAESGVPVFRGADGLWQGHRPEELASPEAFRRDPEKVWEFYDWRRCVLSRCSPNAGHRALAELERRFEDFTLVTQNVDGLHQEAGSRHVYELHGNIWRVRRIDESGPGEVDPRAPMPRPLPARDESGALLRPCVVWFGEMLPMDALMASEQAARRADVFFVVGTSGMVEPAASLARVAKASGARVVEINPEETALTDVADDVFREPAAAALSRIVEQLED
jgi:NAD-dependent deacetylase